jgi:hypothetical protein
MACSAGSAATVTPSIVAELEPELDVAAAEVVDEELDELDELPHAVTSRAANTHAAAAMTRRNRDPPSPFGMGLKE